MPVLKINGRNVPVDAPEDMPLLWALRDVVGMTGTKFGCGVAMCGACTVLIDGNPARSCVTPLAAIAGKGITTIEGAALQKAWLAGEVPQCGYCQSGQIMSACALLKANPKPSDSDIDKVMSGNVCRCGTYERIREGIKVAARNLAGSK